MLQNYAVTLIILTQLFNEVFSVFSFFFIELSFFFSVYDKGYRNLVRTSLNLRGKLNSYNKTTSTLSVLSREQSLITLEESIVQRSEIQSSKHRAYQFVGCDACGAQCCASHIIFLTFFDFERVSQHFPIFFYIKDGQISLVYFFHNGKTGQKCHYLNEKNQCGIYEDRPYACQAYPFEYAVNRHITADFKHCPALVEGKHLKGIPLMVSGQVNPQIKETFVRTDFIENTAEVHRQTDEFIRFCLEHNLLMMYQNSPLAQKHPSFASQHLADLYIIHQQKSAVLGLKYAKDNPQHYLAIRQHLLSLAQIERISQSN